VTFWADSQRWGMATILLFFLAGLALLWPLADPQKRGGQKRPQQPAP
jgi:MFS-type transporter involved in bile tolerance (Atg22 family)